MYQINAMCPGGSASGCVPTAMSQIMKYWNYPTKGSGLYSYNHTTYGTLSANFGNTTYQWASMPNIVSSSNSAVATIMYHAGVSIRANYSTSGTGAYVISALSPYTNCAEYAFKTYFGYKSTLQGVQRSSYTDANWITLLKNELNASRPILYAGYGDGGGHAFIFDGYDNSNYFHVNWGWGGYYDGYFSVNSLDPDGVGTGGGTGAFNSGHHAIIGVEPPDDNVTYDIRLYDDLNLSSSTIGYWQPFDLTTKVANYGATTFNGDLAAVIFDEDLNFFDFVEVSQGVSLPTMTYVDITFENDGLFSMVPGTYYIAIFYLPTGGNWTIVDDGSYYNLVQLDVVYTSPTIQMFSDIVLTPDTFLTQGQVTTATFNLKNTGGTTFIGDYALGLYDLDANFVQTIGSYSESSGITAGSS
jgi:hypothetical protein